MGIFPAQERVRSQAPAGGAGENWQGGKKKIGPGSLLLPCINLGPIHIHRGYNDGVIHMLSDSMFLSLLLQRSLTIHILVLNTHI